MPAAISAARMERKNFWTLVFSFLAGVSTSVLASAFSESGSELDSWVESEAELGAEPEMESEVEPESPSEVESEMATGARSSTGYS